MNYTGSAMAGPTLFAIIYSSVTVWAAVFSRVLLARRMGRLQWTGIVVVFAGLTVTAFDSLPLGGGVLQVPPPFPQHIHAKKRPVPQHAQHALPDALEA